MPKTSRTAGDRGRPRPFEFLEARHLLAALGELLPGLALPATAESVLIGDMNGDHVVDNFDIDAFEMALVSKQAYLSRYASLAKDYALRGDVSRDGAFDTRDTQPFEKLLVGSPEAAVANAIWISADEIALLPTSGTAWKRLLSDANRTTATPNVSDEKEDADVLTFAKALVGVRLNSESYLAQVRSNVMAAIGTESDGRTLALGRNLASYVIAADLAKLSPADDLRFRTWLRTTLSEELHGDTLRSTQELRPNNWGTMAGASRAAVAVYLGDTAELFRVAKVFKGWLGNRDSYAGFQYGDTSWQANPQAPVGINPVGAIKEGHSIDGALPEEMRRGGPFAWPPVKTNYPWGALQGAVVEAEILYRAGYNAWQWQNRAILRAVNFLYSLGWLPTNDDQWIIPLINARYGTSFAVNLSASPGKIMGWTAWTHQSVAAKATTVQDTSFDLAATALSATGTSEVDPYRQRVDSGGPTSARAAALFATENRLPESATSVPSRKPLRGITTSGSEDEACDAVLAELDPLATLELANAFHVRGR